MDIYTKQKNDGTTADNFAEVIKGVPLHLGDCKASTNTVTCSILIFFFFKKKVHIQTFHFARSHDTSLFAVQNSQQNIVQEAVPNS